MTSLRSSVIRLAHAQPALRPHLLPLLKTADDDGDYTDEEYAFLLWTRKYERRQEAVLRKWEDKYERELNAVGDGLIADLEALKALVRFWFWQRKGNYRDTPGEEAPNFKGAVDAMFHRRRKALVEVKDITDRMAARVAAISGSALFGDDFLDDLNRLVSEYEREFQSR